MGSGLGLGLGLGRRHLEGDLAPYVDAGAARVAHLHARGGSGGEAAWALYKVMVLALALGSGLWAVGGGFGRRLWAAAVGGGAREP